MKWSLATFAVCIALGVQADNIVLKNDNFQRQLYGWNTPSYWAGKTAQIEENGKKYLQLESGTRGAEVFGRALGYGRQIEYFAGTTIQIQLRAKGSGKFNAGVLTYGFNSGTPSYLPGGEKQLTDTFQTFDFKLVIPSRCRQILPYLQVNGEGKLIAEWYKMEAVSEKGASITAKTPMQIIKSADRIAPVTFQSTLPSQKITICRKNDKSVTEKSVVSNANGTITVQPEKQGKGIIELSASAKGVHASTYIDVENPAEYDKTDAIAKRVKLPAKLNILVIGDSLSDFYRGQNYIDRLSFWLNKYNPDKVSVRNAGVGGDYVRRVEERLAGTIPGARHAYRQNMYDNLFAQPYDLIFIFLGQNDTRSLRTQKFEKPLMSPEQQEKGLRSILDFIGKRSKAKVILISPSPSYAQLFEDRSAKMAPGAEMVMYGKKDLVDQYDEVNRKLCKELNLDYVDILTPMRRAKDLKSLYVADGVHLSPEGGRMIADELLKYFAEKYR